MFYEKSLNIGAVFHVKHCHKPKNHIYMHKVMYTSKESTSF